MKFLFRTTMVVLFIFSAFTGLAQDSTARFKVFGACGMCKDRIESSLKIKGVQSAKWEEATQVLSVQFNAKLVSLDDLHKKKGCHWS